MWRKLEDEAAGTISTVRKNAVRCVASCILTWFIVVLVRRDLEA